MALGHEIAKQIVRAEQVHDRAGLKAMGERITREVVGMDPRQDKAAFKEVMVLGERIAWLGAAAPQIVAFRGSGGPPTRLPVPSYGVPAGHNPKLVRTVRFETETDAVAPFLLVFDLLDSFRCTSSVVSDSLVLPSRPFAI